MNSNEKHVKVSIYCLMNHIRSSVTVRTRIAYNGGDLYLLVPLKKIGES